MAETETPAPPPAEPAAELPSLDASVLLAEGTTRWHDPGAGAVEAYDLASQPAAHPCIWDGGDGPEIYFNNQALHPEMAIGPVPAGTRSLLVTLTWAVTDYPGDALVLAYKDTWKGPENASLHESPWIPNGVPTPVPVDFVLEERGWPFWLCVSRADADVASDYTAPPKLVPGEVTVRIEATGGDGGAADGASGHARGNPRE